MLGFDALGRQALGQAGGEVLIPELVLGDYVLDNGLGALATANKILACTNTPTSYANAIALAVGENAASFGAPQVNAGGGRKVSSSAITSGTATGTGFVHRWAAVDTVNSRLLAHGTITGDDAIAAGLTWTLAPLIIIHSGKP